MGAGRHLLVALRVAPYGETVLLEQVKADTANHAAAVPARDAARHFAPESLRDFARATIAEPCAICAGAQVCAHVCFAAGGAGPTSPPRTRPAATPS